MGIIKRVRKFLKFVFIDTLYVDFKEGFQTLVNITRTHWLPYFFKDMLFFLVIG